MELKTGALKRMSLTSGEEDGEPRELARVKRTSMELKTGVLKRTPRRERKTVQPRKLARVVLRANRHQSTLRK